jgi:hypothetical protein
MRLTIGPLTAAIYVLSSLAVAAECAPVQVTTSCTLYQASLAVDVCLRSGSTFVQGENTWKDATYTTISWTKQKGVKFFSVVDAGHTAEPHGALFVGITRHWPKEGGPGASDVKLTQNHGLDFFKASTPLYKYNKAVDLAAAAPKEVIEWGHLPDTPDTQSKSLFDSLRYRSQLKNFSFESSGNNDDFHARLYRFDSGPGIMCIPFYVGTPGAVKEIIGRTLDVFGEPEERTGSLNVQIKRQRE